MMPVPILCFTIISFVVLLICDTTKALAQTTPTITKEHLVLVGGDRDEHGCIGSAGYTWSNVQGQCVRLWEIGIRLEATPWEHWPKNGGIGPVRLSAFILFNKQRNKAELFIQGKKPLVLNRKTVKGDFFWSNKTFKLFPTKEGNGYFLKDGDKTIYSTREEKSNTTE